MIRTRPRAFERPPGWPALMTADIVCAYLGDISRQLLHRWTHEPGFPDPVHIRGVKRWSRSSLDAWIHQRGPSGQPLIQDRTSTCRKATRR